MRRRLAAVAAVVAIVSGCGGGSTDDSAAVPPPSESVGTVVDFSIPPDIANIPLTRPDGTTTSLAAYRGKAVVLTDYMTLCQDICPMITANSLAMARALAADGLSRQTAVLEVTIDPQRDTPARMAAYQKLYGEIPPNFALLRASPANTRALWKYFGVQVRRVKEGKPADTDWLTGKPLTYDVEHSDDLIFIGGDGHERFVVDGSPDTQGKLPPKRLTATLTAQGRRNLYHPDPVASWTVAQGLQVFGWLIQHRSLADRT